MRKYTVYDSAERAMQNLLPLRWHVLEDGKLYAGFEKETAAVSYAMRMNQIQQRLHERVAE